ncbi:MAG TPA: SDR family oxidoreductase [Steroidobacteraceae bacterium]|nr:SDR family oxidoreductase [Steroidobacteraceae bacterium]
MKILAGKAVVITGSGRGIGAACAKGCARRGAAVVVNDIDPVDANDTAAAIVAEGGEAVACVADVSVWEEAGRLIDTCISTFGKIDGLVNNAALYHAARIDAFDPAAARSLLEANVLGPLYCTGRAIKPMLAQQGGSIINVVSGAHMGIANLGIYGATKGAVASMVYTWALELAGTGVRVNGLSPFGATRIALRDRRGPIPEEMAKQLALLPPPEANSPVVEFLLSDLAKSVNGQLVRIDRGELQLYTHPALLLPSVTRREWTAELVAQAFESDFKDRQVPCGVRGARELPVELQSGYWTRGKAQGR